MATREFRMMYVAHKTFTWAGLFWSAVLPIELGKDALDILFLIFSTIPRAERAKLGVPEQGELLVAVCMGAGTYY